MSEQSLLSRFALGFSLGSKNYFEKVLQELIPSACATFNVLAKLSSTYSSTELSGETAYRSNRVLHRLCPAP